MYIWRNTAIQKRYQFRARTWQQRHSRTFSWQPNWRAHECRPTCFSCQECRHQFDVGEHLVPYDRLCARCFAKAEFDQKPNNPERSFFLHFSEDNCDQCVLEWRRAQINLS
jgi:hypothetical protein